MFKVFNMLWKSEDAGHTDVFINTPKIKDLVVKNKNFKTRHENEETLLKEKKKLKQTGFFMHTV